MIICLHKMLHLLSLPYYILSYNYFIKCLLLTLNLAIALYYYDIFKNKGIPYLETFIFKENPIAKHYQKEDAKIRQQSHVGGDLNAPTRMPSNYSNFFNSTLMVINYALWALSITIPIYITGHSFSMIDYNLDFYVIIFWIGIMFLLQHKKTGGKLGPGPHANLSQNGIKKGLKNLY